MRFNMMILLLSTSCICLALAQVSFDDCCLKYVKKMSGNAQKHAVKYRRQEPDGGCNIPAVVFTMRKGRVLCADPREKWVEALMMAIDKKEAKDNGNKHQRRHPRHRFNRG